MADDDTTTTCHQAMVYPNGDMVALIVSTDGEDFVSSLSYLRDFPEEEPDDIFKEQLLAAAFVEAGKNRYLIAEGTGQIIEVEGRRSRTLVDLRVMLAGIAQLEDGQLAAFGPDGNLFVGDGVNWRAIPGLDGDVSAVAGDTTALYVCGSGGLLAVLDDGNWQLLEIGTNASLNGLMLLKKGELLVCGDDGVFGRWSGGEWSYVEAPAVDLYDIDRYRSDIYVGAGSDGLCKLGSERLEIVKDNVFSYSLQGSEKYLAIAGENEVVRFDGKEYDCLEFEEEFE